MPGRALQWRLFAWVGIAVLSAYCLFYAGAWFATYYAEIRIWALIPAFAVVAVWIVIAARDPAWRPRTYLWPAFAVAFVSFALSTIASREPRFSAEYLALTVLLTALYLILQRLMASPFFRPRMLSFAVLAAVLIGTAYVVATFRWWVIWWDTIGRLAAPPLRPHFEGLSYGNPSAVMTVMVLLAAPALAVLSTPRSATRIALAGVVLALTGFATLASGSRAGWLALAMTIASVGVLWAVSRDRRRMILAALRSRTGVLAAIPLGLAAVAAVVVALPGLLLRAGSGGEDLRAGYWASATRMFQTSPVLGTGPGTWAPQRTNFTLPPETDYYIPHAHNVYFQTLAELGIAGLLAGVLVALILARLVWSATSDPDPLRQRMGWAAVFGTVYFAAHQLLDFYANSPAILFAFVIPIVYLDATAPGETKRLGIAVPRWIDLRGTRLGGVVAGVTGVAAVVVSALFLGWSERGALLMREGASLLDVREPKAAMIPLRDAVQVDPAMTPYHLALGLALADSGDLAAAKDHLAIAAVRDGLPETWLNLAAVQVELGDVGQARTSLAEAWRLGYQQPAVSLGVGYLHLQLGDPTAAVDAFASALSVTPTLAGDPWWTATATRRDIWPQVYRHALDMASVDSRFVMGLETSDNAVTERALSEMEGEVATTSRLVARAWQGDRDAFDALVARARERPLDASVVNWCALLLRRTGDVEAAGRYVSWADNINLESSFSAFEVRVAESAAFTRIAGVSSLYYGQFTYRRPMTIHQLVRSLPALEYR